MHKLKFMVPERVYVDMGRRACYVIHRNGSARKGVGLRETPLEIFLLDLGGVFVTARYFCAL